MRIAILTSNGGPGLEALAGDPRRGTVYEIAAVIDAKKPPRNLAEREASDAELAELLLRANPDWVILTGYRYIVTRPLLEAFPNRLVALHDADLTLRDDDGRRRYAGLHAVRNALLDGAVETRASAFLVTEDVGEGPLLLMSGPYRAGAMVEDALRWGSADLVTQYAKLHRDWMVRSAYGPMLLRIVEMLAAGEMQVVGDVVWVDGVPGPCRMGEAPAVCHHTPEGIPQACPFITSR